MPSASSASSIASSRAWDSERRDQTAAQDRSPGRSRGSGRDQGDLRVSYAVRNARWAPLYDARLETGGRERKPALELVRRAEITQQTGEDWATSRSAFPPSGPRAAAARPI